MTTQKPRKKRKKGELTLLAEKLDKALRNAALARDGNKCVWCGWRPSTPWDYAKLHTSHVIPKREGHGLRWDMRNVLLLCSRCHLERWHKNPLEANNWFYETYPDRYEFVWNNRCVIKKFDIAARKRLIELLEYKRDMWLHRR